MKNEQSESAPPGVLRRLLEQIEAVKHAGGRPRVHGNGFVQLDLTPSRRLHVWGDPRIPRQEVPSQIHDHTFSFTSRILSGQIIHRQFSLDGPFEHSGAYRLFRAVVNHGEDTRLIAEPGRYDAVVREERLLRAGDTYTFAAGHFHETIAPWPCVTVIEKDGPSLAQGGASPRVLVPAALQPDNEFDRYAAPAELLWLIIESAFLRVSEGGSPQEQNHEAKPVLAAQRTAEVSEGARDDLARKRVLDLSEGQVRNDLRANAEVAPLPAQAPGVLEQLIKQCQKDAVAHRQEAQAIKRTHPLATRPAYTCEEVLAQVHEYWAKEMEAALAAVGRTLEVRCRAKRTADPPQDCNWPHCGCDPYADRVLAALQEEGWQPPTAVGRTPADGGLAETERRHSADCRAQEAQRTRDAERLQTREAVGRTPREEPTRLCDVCEADGMRRTKLYNGACHMHGTRPLRAGSGPPAAKEPQ